MKLLSVISLYGYNTICYMDIQQADGHSVYF